MALRGLCLYVYVYQIMLNQRTNEQTNVKTDSLKDMDKNIKIKANLFGWFFALIPFLNMLFILKSLNSTFRTQKF